MDKQQVGKIQDNSKSLFQSRVSLGLSQSIQPRNIEQMNLLIIQKISDVVAAYYENIDKLQTYHSQIGSLVDFNKRLINILNQFEAQEDKLIKRLRRMQEVNIGYMREYCQMKGRQFKMPNLPEHKSIFANYSLQDIEFSMKIIPPVAEVKYKEDLISIFKESFLTRQDQLLTNIQVQLQKKRDQTKGEEKILLEIRKLIKQYHCQINELVEAKPFDLLKKRSIIRKKVEQFYDSSRNQSQIKPNYIQQDVMINKLVNLQSKVEEISFESLQNFLLQEKELCHSVQKQRISLYEALKQKQKEQEKINKINIDRQNEIRKLQVEKNQVQAQLNRTKSVFEKEIKDLKNNLVEKELRIEQIQNLIAAKNQYQENVQDELTQLKMQYNRPQKKLKDLQKSKISQVRFINSHTDRLSNAQKKSSIKLQLELISRITTIKIEPTPSTLDLQQKIEHIEHAQSTPSGLQQKIKLQELELEEKQKYIQQLKAYSENVIALNEQHRKQIQRLSNLLNIIQQQNDQNQRDKKMIENLAIQVCQAIKLVSSMSFNPTIKNKMESILGKLESFVEKYQKKFHWDISKQAPGFFLNHSIVEFSPQSNKSIQLSQLDRSGVRNHVYSLDIGNQPAIKETLNIQEQMEQKSKKSSHNRSFGFEKSVQIMIPFSKPVLKSQEVEESPPKSVQQSLNSSSPKKVEVQKIMSLEFPKSYEKQQDNDNDEFQNLRKLYQQSVQCLQMQENKTKSMETQYQKYVEMVMAKQKADPNKFHLEKQLVYLTRLSIEQQKTIDEERKNYNQIFKEYHESFKLNLSEQLNSLRGRSIRGMSQSNNKSIL